MPPPVVLSAFLFPFLGNLLLLGVKYSIDNTLWNYKKILKKSQETLNKELRELEEYLTSISKMNPIQMQIECPSDWLKEIEDFFYRMYDLRDKPEDLASYFTTSLGNVTLKVKEMKAKLKSKQEDMEERLTQTQGQTSSGQSGRQQEFRTCQILWENDKATIVEELKKRTSDLLGVTIVGISGSGKTELANAVIEDESIKEHFPCTCSPPPFTDFDSNKLEIVMEEIEKKAIDPKKSEIVLIFLDGLQKVDRVSWSDFRSFCESELHPESKVLVTSQNPEIANATGSFKHCLPKLCDDGCLTMIKFFAGSNGKLSKEDRKAIKVFRKKLVEKCMGLPLLAKHIGLFLSAQGQGQLENTIKEKLCSDLWMLEDFASVLGNLKLVSLLQEKPLLKWCLNYCSLFPPNTKFNKDLLVQLWMAEGLNLFQTEEQDFDYLVSHSIFQSSDNNDTYEMHQLAYEFAKNVSSRAFYRKDIDKATTSIDIRDMTRHFSLCCKNNIEKNQKTAITKPLDDIGKKRNRLRTFLLVQKAGNIFLKNPTFFTKLELLRVLDLSYTNLSSLSPSTISKLGYLRYLDLSSTPIKKVPGLSNNPALQVLKLSNCKELLKLPKDLTNLTNLSCLQVNTAEKLLNMPPKMGKLSKLRELELFLVGKREEGFGIEELKEMNGLRKSLQIARLENVKSESEAREAELINKLSLETLELRWTADSKPNTEPENVLEGLVPPQSLTELRITNYSGSKFPEWLSNPEVCGGLNTIILDNCNGCSSLPSLEKLELLKCVDLKRMKKLVNLPELPSSVKSLIIEESDALKEHCQNRAAGWLKIRGIRVTIDSEQEDPGEAAVDQVVPHQSSSIQIGDSPAVNDSDSRELHEDCRTPSRMDASRIVVQLQDSSTEEHDSYGQNIDSGRQQLCREMDESRKKGKQKVDEIAFYSQVPHRDNQHRDENYSQKQTKNDTLDQGANQGLNNEIRHVQDSSNEEDDSNGQNIESGRQQPCVETDESKKKGNPKVDEIASSSQMPHRDDQHRDEKYFGKQTKNGTLDEGAHQSLNDEIQHVQLKVHQNEVPIDKNSPSTPRRVDGEGSTALGRTNENQVNSDQLQSTSADNTTASNGDDRQGGKNEDKVNSDQLQSTTANNTTASNDDDRRVHQDEVPTNENSPSTLPRVDGEGSTAMGGINEDQVNSDQLQSTTANNTPASNGDDRQVHPKEVPTDENSPSTTSRVDGEGSVALGIKNEDQVNSYQHQSTTANCITASNDDYRQEKRRSLVGFLSNLCGCVPKEHGKELSSENLPKHI